MRVIFTPLAARHIERRVTIAFVVTDDDAVLIEGIYYGGQDFEAAIRGRDQGGKG